MRKPFLFIILFALSFTSFSQDVFDIGIRKIEIFFSEPNWDDTLNVYYTNDIGQRLLADSIIIDGEKFNAKSVMSLLQVGGIIADKGYQTILFEGDKRAIDDIKLLAKHNYCENGEIPSRLSYLREYQKSE